MGMAELNQEVCKRREDGQDRTFMGWIEKRSQGRKPRSNRKIGTI